MSIRIEPELLKYLHNFDVKVVGERLKQVRLHFSNQTAQKVTQSDVSEILGLNDSNATLSNLEAGKGAIGNFIKLLCLYHGLGYNLNWIILPDNRFEEILNRPSIKSQQQSLEEVNINDILFEKNKHIKNALIAITNAEEELKESLK
ncbi:MULTISPECIES: hypothetical protein [Bacteroidota]|uniref:hypothetical protein n=1 Tax=Bacteroidota TaxID=976 RepID=UPI001D10C04A|nr:hypothetical protein [Sphingobacterium sp. FBM7-1]MCC2600817.1 hypothetical protein [Sphingobacterium sp. FBM7-1]